MIKECLTFYSDGLKREILKGNIKAKAYRNFLLPQDAGKLEEDVINERAFSPDFVASWNADFLVEQVIKMLGYAVTHAYSDNVCINKYVEVSDEEDLKQLQENLKFLRKIGISIDA